MFSNFKNFVKLTAQVIRRCEFQNSFQYEKFVSGLSCDFCINKNTKNFHTSTPRMRISPEQAQKQAARTVTKAEAKITDTFKGDVATKRKEGFFPTVDLPNTLFNNIPFKDLPVIYIKATRNNTHFSLVDQGLVKIIRSCGIDGFKNTRKGTNIAAQSTGTAIGQRICKRGYKAVRVVISGLGAGRLSSIKGLVLSGLEVVSITDKTVDLVTLRPRKQRKL